MKKIPTSITVTVRNGDNFRATRPGKTFEGDGITLSSIHKHSLYHPSLPYRVTYLVDPRGKYLVNAPDYETDCLWLSWKSKWLDEEMSVCFIPTSWIGLRVSRRVEKVKK